MTSQPQERIPTSLGATEYATVWNAIASTREHAFELVDESQTEAQLEASGAALAPYIIKGLSLDANDDVLEIGCGVARLGTHVAPRVRRWTGLDVSENMIRIARQRCSSLENVELVVGNGQDLRSIPAQAANKIYCHAVFIHMDKEDVYNYLCDAKRVLRPGGLFYFDVWNICHEVGWLRWQAERSLYPTKRDRPLHRNQFFGLDELEMMLKMAGWSTLHLAKTFYLQAVVSHAGTVQATAEWVQDMKARYAAGMSVLQYTQGDNASFSEILIKRLEERGFSPEIAPR